MPLSTLQGTTDRVPTSPAPTENQYAQGEATVNVPQDQKALGKEYVRNTFIHDNAVDLDRFGEIIADIRRYIAGFPIKVTYYHKIVSDRNEGNDPDFISGSVSDSYVRIQDFEIKLDASMEYSYLTEENISQYIGEATLYPGMQPHVGDMLVYTVDPGTGAMGMFQITQFNRLSIRSNTCWRVSLQLVQFVDQTDLDELESQVEDFKYFTLDSYIGEKHVLLTSESKTLLNDIQKIRSVLKRHYADQFFDADVHDTFVRPDGVYDPYIIKILNVMFEYHDLPHRIYQLVSNPVLDYKSFWSALMAPDYITTGRAAKYYKVTTRRSETREATINSVLNKEFVVLYDEEDEWTENYISDGLFSLDGEDSTEFDTLVRLYYEQRQIDPIALLTQAQGYASLSAEDQFYRIPVFMFLATLLERTILNGTENTVYGSSVRYLPTELEFDSDNVVDEVLSVSMDNKALGLIDSDGKQWLFPDEAVVYSGNTIHMTISSILDEYGDDWTFIDEPSTYVCSWTAGENTIEVETDWGLMPGMAVEGVTGIPAKTRVLSVDGTTVTLSQNTDAEEADGESVDVKIDWATVNGTWKAVFTGNTVEEA